MEISSVLTNKNSTINKLIQGHVEERIWKVNQENGRSTIRESHVTQSQE